MVVVVVALVVVVVNSYSGYTANTLWLHFKCVHDFLPMLLNNLWWFHEGFILNVFAVYLSLSS